MRVTNVKVSRVKPGPYDDPRLLAFCSVTLDGAFVVHDVRLIEGRGGPVVMMPSRRMEDKCPDCKARNALNARLCNQCGVKLADGRTLTGPDGRPRRHADVAHPCSREVREGVERAVIAAYEAELAGSVQAGEARPC